MAGAGRPRRCGPRGAHRRGGAPRAHLGGVPQRDERPGAPGGAVPLRAPLPGAPPLHRRQGPPLLRAGALADAAGDGRRRDPHGAPHRRPGRAVPLPPAAAPGDHRPQDAHHLPADAGQVGPLPGALPLPALGGGGAAGLQRGRGQQPLPHLRGDPGGCPLPLHVGQRAVLRPQLHPGAGVPGADRHRRHRRPLPRHLPEPGRGPLSRTCTSPARRRPRASASGSGRAG
jgi:hypothetical protein